MLTKINVSSIFIDHLDTLKDFNSDKISAKDYFCFFGIPIILSGILLYSANDVNKEVANMLITCFSIFAALLLNLLMIIFDLIKKVNDKINDFKENQNATNKTLDNRFKLENIRKTFLKEIYSNISYSILISVIGIILLLSFYFVKNPDVIEALSAFTYVIVFNFLMTLLMIIKRVHLLLSGEVDKKPKKEKNKKALKPNEGLS